MPDTPDPASRKDSAASRRDRAAAEQPTKAAKARLDDTVAASFPASDPPATWTWEVRGPERAQRD